MCHQFLSDSSTSTTTTRKHRNWVRLMLQAVEKIKSFIKSECILILLKILF